MRAPRLGMILPLLALAACAEQQTVLVRMQGSPAGALVYIDDRYIGRLEQLQARGIKMPPGEHRLTIEEVGYFPYDRLLRVDEEPILLEVELTRIPD